jgi:hypothetical protein
MRGGSGLGPPSSIRENGSPRKYLPPVRFSHAESQDKIVDLFERLYDRTFGDRTVPANFSTGNMRAYEGSVHGMPVGELWTTKNDKNEAKVAMSISPTSVMANNGSHIITKPPPGPYKSLKGYRQWMILITLLWDKSSEKRKYPYILKAIIRENEDIKNTDKKIQTRLKRAAELLYLAKKEKDIDKQIELEKRVLANKNLIWNNIKLQLF